MHGKRAEQAGHKRRSKEYWKSRLHRYGEVVGRFTKKLTHKKERRLNARIEREEKSNFR